MFEVFNFLENTQYYFYETGCRWKGEVICDGDVVQVNISCISIFVSVFVFVSCICISSEFMPRMKKAQPHYDYPQDLYIWWFETHCNKGRLSVVGRSWGEVVKDPRFKP